MSMRPPSRLVLVIALYAGLVTGCGDDEPADLDGLRAEVEDILGGDLPDPRWASLVESVDEACDSEASVGVALAASDGAAREALLAMVAEMCPDRL